MTRNKQKKQRPWLARRGDRASFTIVALATPEGRVSDQHSRYDYHDSPSKAEISASQAVAEAEATADKVASRMAEEARANREREEVKRLHEEMERQRRDHELEYLRRQNRRLQRVVDRSYARREVLRMTVEANAAVEYGDVARAVRVLGSAIGMLSEVESEEEYYGDMPAGM